MSTTDSTGEHDLWLKRAAQIDVAEVRAKGKSEESAKPDGKKQAATSPGGQEPPKEAAKPTGRATPLINWNEPAAVAWTPGGLTLGPTQLNATILPADLVLTYTPASSARLDVGSHTLRVDSAETDAYLAASKTVTLIIDPVPATIAWGTPGKLSWKSGLKLSDVLPVLTVTPPETNVSYSPGPDTVLGIGDTTVTASITDKVHFAADPKSVTLKVDPAPATITWGSPGTITWKSGLKLGDVLPTLTVAPPEAGVTHSPGADTVLIVGDITVTASITDKVHFAADSKSVTLKVGQAPATITWGSPGTITWKSGLKLSEVLPTLAVVPPEAGVTHSPGPDTVLDIGDITVTASITDKVHFAADPKSVTLKVGQAPATITWGSPGTITWKPGLKLRDVVPALSVDPPEAGVTHTPGPDTPLSAGDLTVKASITDTTHFVAESKSVTLKVARTPATVIWDAPDPQDHADAGFVLTKTQLNAMVSPGAGGPTYTPAEGAKLGLGTHKLKVVFAESPTHDAVTAEVDFEVRKPRPAITWATPAAVDYVKDGFVLTKTELSAKTTPDGIALTFTPAEGAKVNAGKHELKASVTDTAKYDPDPATVTLEVRKAKPIITWATPAVHVLAGTATNVTLANGTAPLNATLTAGESTLTYNPAAGIVLEPGKKGGGSTPPLVPRSFLITAVHAESANYAYAEQTVTFTVAPSVSSQEGYDKANSGEPGFKTALDPTVKAAWDNDTGKVKTQAKELVSDLRDMTPEEIIEHLDKLADVTNKPGNYETDAIEVGTGKKKVYYNKCWKLPNGLQVRLKPNGDPFTNPRLVNPPNPKPTGWPDEMPSGWPKPIPMVAVEIRSPSCFDFTGSGAVDTFSSDGSNTATKVTASGNPGPWGPGQTTEDGKTGNQLQEFTDASTQATHHQARTSKKTQVIVCDSPLKIPHGTKLNATELGIRLQPGNGDISFDQATDTVLAVGNHSVVITAATTKGFEEAKKTVQIVVEKAKPHLVWKQPADVEYAPGGFELTGTQLNAVLTPAILSQPVYNPALGGKLDAGKRPLRADVAANANREAATATVTLTVKKATPVITLKTNASRQNTAVGEGVALAVDDVVAQVQPQGLAVTLDPPVGTVLPPGTYSIQARFTGDGNIRATATETSFTVTAGTV